MKNTNVLFSILFFTMALYSCTAQELIKPENTMLWKIEHSEIQHISYLYGTMHEVCIDFKIPKKVTQALDIVDALVIEVDFPDPIKWKSLEEVFKDTDTISDALTQDEFDQLDSSLSELLGSSLINFDRLGLVGLIHLVGKKLMPCRSFEIKSLETELARLTTEHHKAIYSLETSSESLEAIKNINLNAQIVDKLTSIESIKLNLHEVYLAYQQEDLNSMIALVETQEDQNEVNYLLIERNKNWMEKMPEMMKLRSNMFAVGASHLPADYGLINLLRENGYSVTPVHTKWYEQ